MVFSIGFLLNIFLFIVVLVARRRNSSVRGQSIFVCVLTMAHSLYCCFHLTELTFLKLNQQTRVEHSWSTCVRVLKDACKPLWHLVVIGAVFGCAIDNYLAVCRPMRHRVHKNQFTKLYALSSVTYIVLASLMAFFDLYSSTTLEPDCLKRLTGFESRLIVFEQFTDFSSFRQYCNAITHCDRSITIAEALCLLMWPIAATGCILLYARTAAALRSSLLFAMNNSPPPSLVRSKNQSLATPERENEPFNIGSTGLSVPKVKAKQRLSTCSSQCGIISMLRYRKRIS